MELRHVPLLRPQRELLDVPRGMERFRAYLDTMLNPGHDDVQLPLTSFNPMSKEHVRAVLDELIALDAEAVCACAIADGAGLVAHVDAAAAQVGLVVVDDKLGGWTHRTTTDLSRRQDPTVELSRCFLTVAVWSSEPPSIEIVRRDTIATIARAAHALAHGKARTLRALLTQEASVARTVVELGGASHAVSLDADDLAYTADVIAPLMDRDDWPTLIAALYGDEAAKSLGHRPLGLSKNAGLSLAWSR